MQKNPKLLVIFGVIALAIGAVISFGFGGAVGASAAQEAACRAEMAESGGEAAAMADRCNEATFAIAMTANRSGMTAQEAGAAIAAANQSEVGGSTLGKLLMGLGFGLLIGGTMLIIRQKQR